MSEYGEGVRIGREGVSKENPFSAYIKRVDEARARQLADQKDVQDLKNLFSQLEKKHEYDTKIEEQKRQVGLELEKEKGVQNRLNKLSEGYTFDESGNEVAPTTQPTPQAQPVDRNQRLLQMTGLAMPTSGAKNRVGAMAPAPVSAPKAQPREDNSMLAEQFGLGKGVKLRKKENATSAVSLTPEESLTKIPKGEDPEDYIPKPMVRKVNNEATEIYLAEKKQKVPAKQLDDLRLLGINISDLSRNLEVKKIKGIDTGPSIVNRPGVIADIIGNLQGKKDLLSFKAEVDKAFQKYRKETTGVQAGYKELNWLAPDFPKVTDEDAVFIQKSEDAINTVKINQNMFLDYLKDNGYAVGKLRKSILGQKSSNDPEYDKMKQLIGQ